MSSWEKLIGILSVICVIGLIVLVSVFVMVGFVMNVLLGNSMINIVFIMRSDGNLSNIVVINLLYSILYVRVVNIIDIVIVKSLLLFLFLVKVFKIFYVLVSCLMIVSFIGFVIE